MESNSRRDFLANGAKGFAGFTAGALVQQTLHAQAQERPNKIDTEIKNGGIKAVYSELRPQINAVYKDPIFQEAFQKLDVERFSEAFNSFTENIIAYNKFHRRERRLWSVKIGKGNLSPELEKQFIKMIPEGRKNYKEAFTAIDSATEILIESGLHKVVDKHITQFTSNFANQNHPFSQLFIKYLKETGCSQEMIDEFMSEFSIINYDFISIVEEGFIGLREFTARGVEAQISIMDYTEENGFSYLRGKWGPPVWAITASKILATAGISISAWVIVAIIASLIIILSLICNASPERSRLRRQCNRLANVLPIFIF